MKRLPKDGYYFCQLNCPTRGQVGTAVKIHKGKVTDYLSTPQDPKLLSRFRKMSVDIYVYSYVYYFRHDAVKELLELRKFKAARMKQLSDIKAGLL